jgi:hypothetical protein
MLRELRRITAHVTKLFPSSDAKIEKIYLFLLPPGEYG